MTQLIQEDCCQQMAGMPKASVDLVVTSPPYNLGIQYASFKDTATRGEYLEWCKQWATEIRRIMTPKASFFLNVAGSPSSPMMPYQILNILTEIETDPEKKKGPEFVLQNTFHWIKSITVKTPKGESVSAGHFKPINSKRFVNDCHEFVFHLTCNGDVELDRKAAGVPYADKSNIARFQHTGGVDLRCRGNNWFIPYETITSRNKERPHPATFPVALAEQCILLHGNPEKTRMLDPFVGIGSSAVAAVKQSVQKFTGIDIDPEYLETARERIQNAKS